MFLMVDKSSGVKLNLGLYMGQITVAFKKPME
jgi:hypothetical protein